MSGPKVWDMKYEYPRGRMVAEEDFLLVQRQARELADLLRVLRGQISAALAEVEKNESDA